MLENHPLYMAQGFVTAQDRLFPMDLGHRVGQVKGLENRLLSFPESF
ncbi:penicillin acylase family protein [Bacillus songklensis]|uniref:Penicillin acylase family protein n=1 Tax=Bacillus songklensis TaxID=1069116 RepID=A0ABV8B4B8_9BACI